VSSEEEPKDVDIPDQFDVKYIEMSDGAKLRCLSYNPDEPKGYVLMYPGMNTVVLSWIRVLEGLSEANYHIDYVESREKHTSKLQKDDQITRERMILDCEEAIAKLGFKEQHYIVIGSSLGSTTLVHNMAKGAISPDYAVLVGPSTHFTVPFGIRILMPFVTKFTYEKIGLPIIKKIALRKFTNEDADPKQKEKYSLALDLANPIKLKTTLKEWSGNKIWDDLPKIDGQKSICILIGASEDKLHPDEETRAVADAINNSKFIDLKTNTAAHDKPLIDMIKEFEFSS